VDRLAPDPLALPDLSKLGFHPAGTNITRFEQQEALRPGDSWTIYTFRRPMTIEGETFGAKERTQFESVSCEIEYETLYGERFVFDSRATPTTRRRD
jgi:hypothetical protein